LRSQARDQVAVERDRLQAEVAERARVEVALRASEARYRAIVETAHEGIWLVDREMRTIYANPRMAALLGVSVHDLQSRPVFDFILEEDRVIARERARERMAGASEQFDFRFRRGDGGVAEVLASSCPLRDDGGAVIGALGMFTDMTAQRALERAREEFVFSAAHDLKNPLTAIRGIAQLAQRRLTRHDPPDVAALLAHLVAIQESTEAMLVQINELVDVTRQQIGVSVELHPTPIDLIDLVQECIERHRAASGRTIHLEAEMTQLPATVDASRIGRVVSNLLDNAIKYSNDEARIWVQVVRDDGPRGLEAMIAVRDEGLGIPAADLPYIFDRFRRAGNVVGHIRGTGIGLASVRGIVEQHGGTVAVESVEGTGSTFTVRLPLTSAAAHVTVTVSPTDLL
jgi:PAS domain S-box-containing protein